jgi:SAM-dependent methyltransferase
MRDELGLDGHGRMLDVGCGPGILAIRLARFFDEVIGLDPDADMLAEGRRAASDLGIDKITWTHATAEELPAASPGPFRLVTFGQSFHRVDEAYVAEAVYDMLEPDGAVAMIAHSVEGRRVPESPGFPPIPHDEMRALVKHYLGSLERNGSGFAAPRSHTWQDILAASHFGEVDELFAPGVPNLLRNIDTVISGYLSMSWSAPHLYGDRLDEFVAEARNILEPRSRDGLFWDWPGDTVIVLGRKGGVST